MCYDCSMSYINYIIVCFLVIFSSLNLAVDFDAIVPFSGSKLPAAKFYYPINQDYDFIFGFSSVVPASREKELDVDVLLGVHAQMPLVGYVDMYASFGKKYGTSRSSEIQKNKFTIASATLSKYWVYPLTESIDLGASVTLARAVFNEINEVQVFSEIEPVLLLTIDFFD